MAIDNQHSIEDRLEMQIRDFIKRFGVATFLEYVARIIREVI